MKFEILTAEDCAWRAVYLYVNNKQVAHIGVDPNDGVTPVCFGGIAHKSFRLPLPRVPWRYPHGRLYLKAYKLSQAFWHNVDGRYGWFSKQ